MNEERRTSREEIAFLNGETKYLIQEGVGLYFDPQRWLFTLVGTQFNLVEASNLRGLYEFGLGYRKRLDEGLVYTPIGLVETPDLRRKLAEIASDPDKKIQAIKTTTDAIEFVFRLMTKDKLPRKIKDENLWSVFANIDDTGAFRLNTFGNCACLGTDPQPSAVSYGRQTRWSWREDPTLPIAYAPHNIDTDAQTLSLLAGAGTLAWIADGRT